jgi:hypothetical protein
MHSITFSLRRLFLCSILALATGQFDASAFAQTRPHLFRQRPTPVKPDRHATDAYEADVDQTAIAANPESMTLELPGKPDLVINRHQHQQRSARSSVWRGHAQEDPNSKITLTLHEGILLGHIQIGSEIYTIRPGRNGRSIVEKLDTDSFNPEWGHDHATHGHDKVPPKPTSGAEADTGVIFSAPSGDVTSAAATATTEIVLMSVYTPQARAAAGGATQIQAQIQAAVDQANTAFINSNMTARFFLGHTAEVAYNDSGNIETDLNWVTGNSTIASLRNTYAADMVSLITENGGGYCGIGWVQRNPGSSFANYAFQVTARSCLSNSTLAHEHGHNMGMEHDPANAGISPAGASYDWSFGHNVPGSFRTVMSYSCASPCPRILNYSNPDVLYNGVATGVLNQRDNAWTGDLTAPIVAAFRSGGGSVTNSPPAFSSDLITRPDATQGVSYASTIAGSASDPNSDTLTYSKSAGPAWLIVAGDGALSGVPGSGDVGTNSFTVAVSDGHGGTDSATLQINVVSNAVSNGLNAPSNLVGSSTLSRKIDLTWTDNSSNEKGFKIERSTDGINFSRITTRGANVTSYTDSKRTSGRTYYYRVYSYNSSAASAYSNVISVVAK